MEGVHPALEGLLDELAQFRLEGRRRAPADEPAVAAGARQHRELLDLVAFLAQDQDAGAFDVEQRGDLRQHALGEALHGAEIEQAPGGVDDDLEPAAGLDHALELEMAAQRRRQRREELVGGELGLRLVVVDVVVDDHPPLRRLAGLAGAQDDADGLVPELVADVVDELEPGALALHDDVEQHHRDVRMLAQELAAFLGRVGREDLEALPVEHVIVEREAGAVMDRGVVVDDGDLPAPAGGDARLGLAVLDDGQEVVVLGHRQVSRLIAIAGGWSSSRGATRGRLIRNVVPAPAIDESTMRPPRRRVMRL